jgi:Fis family transcriptional regulator
MEWAFLDAVRVIFHKTGEAMELGKQMEHVIEACRFGNLNYAEAVREFKKRFIGQVLTDHAFNQSRAARELGMHRNTMSRTISELEIDIEQLRLHKKPIQSPGLAELAERVSKTA